MLPVVNALERVLPDARLPDSVPDETRAKKPVPRRNHVTREGRARKLENGKCRQGPVLQQSCLSAGKLSLKDRQINSDS